MTPELKKLFATEELADLGPGPRAKVMGESAVREAVTRVIDTETRQRSDLLLALMLLWHDHLDAAHTLAQAVENADGSYVHAIMHRREPDYWNSKYWFRRVGQHTTFAELARRAGEAIDASGRSNLRAQLLPAGRWDPMAFVDACERAAATPEDQDLAQVLRHVQQAEFEVLAEYLAGGKG